MSSRRESAVVLGSLSRRDVISLIGGAVASYALSWYAHEASGKTPPVSGVSRVDKNCDFIDPLNAVEFGGFEPIEVEEANGIRIVTPFYSVLLTDEMLARGCTYSTNMGNGEKLCPWDEDAHYLGLSLSVDIPGEDGFWVTVTSTDWLGVQGDYVACAVAPVPGNPNFQVVVNCWQSNGSDSVANLLASIAPHAELVGVSVVAVRDESSDWRVEEVDESWPHVGVVHDGEVLKTKHYAVDLDAVAVSERVDWRFFPIERKTQSWPNGTPVETDFLAIFTDMSSYIPDVVVYAALPDGDGICRGLSSAYTEPIDLGTDGADWHICIVSPIYGEPGVPWDSFDYAAALDRAERRLDVWKEYVRTAHP